MIFTFDSPQYLFLLAIIPLLWSIHFFSINSKKKKALKFANFPAIAKITGIDFFSKNLISLILSTLIVLFLVLSASGTNLHITPLRGSSFYSFVIALDSSQSMSARDFFPNRLSSAKATAKNFVEEIPIGTKIGLISFSSFTYIENELTDKKSEVLNSISSIELSNYGGTDLYEAVLTSSNLLENEKNKAMIVLSDGQINIGVEKDIIDYASRKDISIYSIAIGTKQGAETQYSAVSKLDEAFLKNISQMTGGQYFSVENEQDLALSFNSILRLTKEKTALNLSLYFLLFALALFVLLYFFINTRYLEFI